MSWFDFKIMYWFGNQDQKPDMLTQWSQDLLMNFSDEWVANWLWILLSFKWFEKIWLVFTDPELDKDKSEIDKWDMNLDELMDYEYAHNSWIVEITNVIKTGQWQHKDIMLAECELWNDRLYYCDNMIVPNSELLWFKILEFAHDAAVAGHPGRAKTYEIVQRSYYWPGMHDFVWRYVQSCQTCVQEKLWHVKKQGVLRPLSVPMRWWCDILINFIVELSNSNEYMNVMIVVNQLTKMRHMILLKTLDASAISKISLMSPTSLREHTWARIFTADSIFNIF